MRKSAKVLFIEAPYSHGVTVERSVISYLDRVIAVRKGAQNEAPSEHLVRYFPRAYLSRRGETVLARVNVARHVRGDSDGYVPFLWK